MTQEPSHGLIITTRDTLWAIFTITYPFLGQQTWLGRISGGIKLDKKGHLWKLKATVEAALLERPQSRPHWFYLFTVSKSCLLSMQRQPVDHALRHRHRHIFRYRQPCGFNNSIDFKIAFICSDILTLTLDHLTLRAYHCVALYTTTTTTTVLRPFVRDYPGEPVPEETFTHPPTWSSSNLYQSASSIYYDP